MRVRNVRFGVCLLMLAGWAGSVSAQEVATPPAEVVAPPAEAAAPALSFQFVVAPLQFENIQSITPLGNLNPPAHTFPTDHIYFFHHVGRENDAPYDVFAPADGRVTSIERGADDAVYIAASATHTYYLGHIVLDPAITFDQPIAAGQRLGTTGPISHAIDLGVLNSSLENAFINPERYSRNSRQAEPPFRYFTDAFKAQLGPLVTTVSGNLEGRFVFDNPITLGGNWFHESLQIFESVGPAAGPRHVAFATDLSDPSRRVVSLGGTVGLAGVYYLDATDQDPASITAEIGPVTFHLSNTQQGTTGVPMVVTVLPENRIRIQFQDHDEVYTR